MARSKTSAPPPSPVLKVFSSLEEVDRGIAKLQRRIEEVKSLQGMRYPDQKIDNVEANIQNSVLEIFGPESPEYRTHKHHEIYDGPHFISMAGDGPDPRRQMSFEAGIPKSISALEGLIATLQEKREDFEAAPVAVASAAFHGLSLHERIAGACAKLYDDGHYPEAVFAAAKSLTNYVREKSQRHDLDGADLMRQVFRPKAPILTFNDLSDQSDLDEQDGMMNLFAGVVLGVRNPRAHSFMVDTPDRALEYIGLISLLAKRLDEAQLA